MSLGKKMMFIVGAAMTSVMLVSSAAAATGYTFFGDAEYVSPGNTSSRAVQIRSDNTAAEPFGGIGFDVPDGTTFGDLDQLSSDFMPQVGDLCTLGSPRFSIGIDTDDDGVRDGTIFVYFGVDSASPACIPGVWQNTTDLLESGKLLDTSQLPGGTFYDPYDAALLKYNELNVTSISVLVESGYAHPDGEQTFFIDNTIVGETLYTYEIPQPETADDCKKGGWQELARADGTPFKNQGDCIQYVNTGK